ncbi:glycoside hydrolase family 16 protein [Hypoxylon sp. CI-4A]|nr:glycoside hydrolase family 16 protein [Hypoxylon sp. CI-4A]
MIKGGIIGLLTALGLTAFANGQLEPDCNPLKTNCQPKKALSKDSYYIDFTKETSLPEDWTIADHAVVNFTSNGAEFSYTKNGDAPNMWSDFYVLGGRYDVEMKIAPGQGVISSAVLSSDTQDEINFEFSGNQFGQKPFPPKDGKWAIETNVHAQGKMWDGAATYKKDAYKPAEQFHKYSVEWDESHVSWYVDDKVVRSIAAKDTPNGFTFPQSPMKLQLGAWGGGDSDNSFWTKQWAGGEVDLKSAPYTMFVKSVKITNKSPACQYKYNDKVCVSTTYGYDTITNNLYSSASSPASSSLSSDSTSIVPTSADATSSTIQSSTSSTETPVGYPTSPDGLSSTSSAETSVAQSSESQSASRSLSSSSVESGSASGSVSVSQSSTQSAGESATTSTPVSVGTTPSGSSATVEGF